MSPIGHPGGTGRGVSGCFRWAALAAARAGPWGPAPVPSFAMSTQSFRGSCHCGDVRYRVTLALDTVASCNCSICSRTGTLLAFAPAAQFELLAGAEALTDYQFGKKRIHHLFCRRCGIRSFCRATGRDGTPTVAINVRCLEGVDLDALPVKRFDGKSLPIEA